MQSLCQSYSMVAMEEQVIIIRRRIIILSFVWCCFITAHSITVNVTSVPSYCGDLADLVVVTIINVDINDSVPFLCLERL